MTTSDPAELLRAFRARVRETVERDLAREAAASEALSAEVLPKLRESVGRAREEGECGRAWLFGSFAWGEPGERSDIDLLVESCPDPDGLAGKVWRACDRPVHVVELRSAPQSLVDRVLADGIEL
jgi:predicted nucleotidyltransferase